MQKEVGLLLILSVSLTSPLLDARELIDPTRPQVGAATSPPELGAATSLPKRKAAARSAWTLESILVAADRRVAVINGELVSEGESIDGAHVIEIRELDVLVRTPRGRMTLQLLPGVVKESS